ncbi:hypothetical protein BLNAU_16432 [Blattamonas nauphoetae]|uniref:Uncharacterized protein n=1 Tax=Blattamonas nauphoetae TaxID=2049346 RepID=A0ABQ9X8E6_9EUKA|nr:hypothetical protein BLNAU_16432 [Blattamonas nauphoetae]
MFFLFALLSASNFQSVSNAQDGPTDLALEDQVPNEGTANLVLTFAAATDCPASSKITVIFVEQGAGSANAADDEVTIEVASTPAPDATKKTVTCPLTGIGGTKSLQFGATYNLKSYQYKAETAIPAAGPLAAVEITIEEPLVEVTVTVEPKTVTTLTIVASIEKAAEAKVEAEAVFTPKTKDAKEVKKTFTFAKGDKSASAEFKLAAAEAADTLVYGEEYTITCAGFYIKGSPITIEDYTKLTITPKLDKAGEKADGAKDHVSLTFVNGLLPAEVAKETPKQNLKLTTVEKPASNEDFVLNKAEGIEWTHTKGQLVVKYIYDVAKMNKYPAGSDVKLKATLEVDDLKWENVEFAYTEGAKSVASVVAALFAVLALVF